MTSITFFLIFIPLLAIVLLVANIVFAPHNPYQEKNSPFECGYHSFLGQNRTQFSISFFIFALLFLLFDLEILLVYPYIVSAYTNDVYGLIVMLIFFLMLTLGFAFELGKNALKIDSRQMLTIAKKQLAIASVTSSFYISNFILGLSIICPIETSIVTKYLYFIALNLFRYYCYMSISVVLCLVFGLFAIDSGLSLLYVLFLSFYCFSVFYTIYIYINYINIQFKEKYANTFKIWDFLSICIMSACALIAIICLISLVYHFFGYCVYMYSNTPNNGNNSNGSNSGGNHNNPDPNNNRKGPSGYEGNSAKDAKLKKEREKRRERENKRRQENPDYQENKNKKRRDKVARRRESDGISGPTQQNTWFWEEEQVDNNTNSWNYNYQSIDASQGFGHFFDEFRSRLEKKNNNNDNK